MIKKLVKKTIPEKWLIHLQAADHYFNGEPELRLMKRVCDSRRLALDIGANIGTYTYFLQRFAAGVWVYEPNPELAKRLAQLFPRANIRNVAVSDASANLRLKIPVENGRIQHELASVSQEFEDSETVVYEVPAITIDSEGLDNVGFIKIDVEQHETAVLKGALGTIQQSRPILMTEVTPLLYDTDLRSQFSFLTDLDYEGWFAFDGEHLPFSGFEPDVHANAQQFGKHFMNTNVFFFPAEVDARSVFES